MKPYLFFDFDELKFNTTPALVSYVNQRWKIDSIHSDYVNNNDNLDLIIKKYRTDIEINRGEIYEDIGKNFHSSILQQKDVQPMKDMCEIVTLLSKKYTLWTVTARQKAGMHVIQYLLDKHIPGCITGIHCVWEHMGNGNYKEISKKDFVESVSGEKVAFIDDSPKEILKMQATIPSYLFDPDRLHEGLTQVDNRVYGWKEIGERFL